MGMAAMFIMDVKMIMMIVAMMVIVVMMVVTVVAMGVRAKRCPNEIKAHGANHGVACTFEKAGEVPRRAPRTCHHKQQHADKGNRHEGLNDGAEKGNDNTAFQFVLSG